MADRLFETLADPTRRKILHALRSGERPVGSLVRTAGIRQSGVSRHLRILEEAGFVRYRRDGQRHCYALRPAPFREIDRWVDQYRDIWEARLDRLTAALDGISTGGAPARGPRRAARP